jgi:drug/metabolite transporter (DMT)-like permease
MTTTRKISGVTLAYIALAFVWGSSFLFMKIGLEGLSAGQVALGRIALGALALVAIMVFTRRKWPREPRVWLHLAVVGAAMCTVPFTLFAWAETMIPSTVASIVNASTPIMTLLLTPLLLPTEKLSRTQRFGLFIGIIGVIVLVGPWRMIMSGDSVSLPGMLAALGATVCYGFGGLYMRRFLAGVGYDSITIAAVQMITATGLSLLIAPLVSLGPVTLTTPVVLAMLTLGILGSGIAYIWFTMTVRAWGAARASTVTYLTPVVGVTFGALFLGEGVHWNEPVGGLIVILGIVASQGLLERFRQPAVAVQ